MRDSVERLSGLCIGTVSFSILSGRLLMQADMAAAHADDDPPVPLKSDNDPVVIKNRYLAHTAISTCSAVSP